MKKKKASAFQRLMEYAGTHKILIYLSLALSFVGSLIALLPLVMIYNIIREAIAVSPDFSAAKHIVSNGFLAVVFALLTMGIYFVGLMCSHKAAFRIAGNIRKALLGHICLLPVHFSEDFGSGKLRKIINDTSAAAETYLAHNLPDMAGAVATPIGMLVMMFIYDWRYALVSLVPIVFAFAAMTKMIGPAMQEDMKQYNDALEDMNNNAVEYVRGIPVVKTFGQTVHSFSRFKKTIDDYSRFCMAYTKRMRQPMLMFQLFINSAFAFLIALVLILSKGTAVTQDILLNFLFYVIITPAIATTLSKVLFMSEGGMTVEDAFRRIDSVLQIQPLAQTETADIPQKFDVVFHQVTFHYNGSETPALNHVSFTVQNGKTLALVGPSGGGKTTVSRLAARFWDVKSGSITVGGVDVSTVDPETLLGIYSTVFQDVTLFDTNIMENIRIGRKDATDEEVIAAAKLANVDEFVAALPDGYYTQIGENGALLSGGERQRISIARAFLKDAPIILLDEATASLDTENETFIQSALSRLIKNKTVLIIVHRMRTVAGADKIVVIKDGKAAEQGTPKQLYEQGGIFTKMVNLQRQAGEGS